MRHVDDDFGRLARGQISEAIAAYPSLVDASRPRDGWIVAVREALDMTVRQLAARLGVAPSSAFRLEQRERDETISLGALRRPANALGCDLVYAIVPRRSPSMASDARHLDALIEARAREVAEAEVGRVAHTMALEEQQVRPSDLEAEIAKRAAALARTPRRLWDMPAARSTGQRLATRGRPRRSP